MVAWWQVLAGTLIVVAIGWWFVARKFEQLRALVRFEIAGLRRDIAGAAGVVSRASGGNAPNPTAARQQREAGARAVAAALPPTEIAVDGRAAVEVDAAQILRALKPAPMPREAAAARGDIDESPVPGVIDSGGAPRPANDA